MPSIAARPTPPVAHWITRSATRRAHLPSKRGGRFSRKDLHALAEVARAEQRQQLQEHVVDVLVEGLGEAHAHHALGGLHGERRVARDLSGERARFLQEQRVGHDARDEAELETLLGVERAAGEDQLRRLRPADQPRQEPGAAALGQHAAAA